MKKSLLVKRDNDKYDNVEISPESLGAKPKSNSLKNSTEVQDSEFSNLVPSSKPDLSSSDEAPKIPNMHEIYEAITGSIQDIKPENIDGQNLDVFIFHLDFGYVKSTLKDHPAVRSFPIHLMWKKKSSNVNNGDGNTNGEYTVLKKQDFEVAINGKNTRMIKTRFDSTPQEDFWSNGNQVLCGIKKENHQLKRMKNIAKSKINQEKGKTQRSEFTKSQGLSNDPTAILKRFESAVSTDRSDMQAKVRDSGITDVQKMEALNQLDGLANSDPEEALRQFELKNF